MSGSSPRAALREILRGHRLAAGLTQEQLAERSGLSVRAISDLERGRSIPRPGSLQKLAAALGLSPEQHARLLSAVNTGIPLPATGELPLQGRELALKLLAHHLAGEGRPLLLFSGEPGIGKTRLLQEAARRAANSGFTVLWGRADRSEYREPYGALRELLRTHIASLPPGLLPSRLEGCAWLVVLLPELAGRPLAPLPPQPVPEGQEQSYLTAAVARFLQNGAGPAGTLLILDDLHRIDADTIDLYASILRSGPHIPLRMVAAYRDSELQPGDPLDTVLSDLAGAGLASHHALQPLSEGAAAALLRAVLDEPAPEEQIARVLEQAGGVPSYLVSYAHDLLAGQSDGVPWDLARSVRQRVAGVSAGAQEVLHLAAIWGGEVRRDRLVAAISGPPERVDAALDEACRARLLVVEAAGSYRFAHDLIRESIEQDLGAEMRAELHRRAARALEETPGEALPVEELAYHYSYCDTAAAARYFELAGDRAHAQGASRVAESSYREAIARLDREDRQLDAARVRRKLGHTLRSAGRGYVEALEALERAADIYKEEAAWEELGRTAAEIAYVHAARGTAQEGIDCLAPLRLLLETEVALGAAVAGLAHLEAALAQLYITAGLLEEHLGALERAAVLARQADDPAILATAQLSRGVALVIMGRLPEGVAALQEGGRLAEEGGNLSALVTALVTASSFLVSMRELDAALAHLQRAREVAEQLGDLVELPFIYFLQGEALRYTGRWEQAVLSYERGLSLSRQVEGSWVGWAPGLGLGTLALDRGEPEKTRQYLAESKRQAQRSGYPYAVPWIETMLVMEALRGGRTEDASAYLRQLHDLPPAPVLSGFILVLEAWAYLNGGDLEAADAAAAQAEAGAARERGPGHAAHALWIRAQIAIRQQRWASAEELLDRALSLVNRWQDVPAEMLLLEGHAALARAQGRMDVARSRLETLRERFRRLGAPRQVQRIAAEIASLPEIDLPVSQNTRDIRFEMGVTDAEWDQIQQILPHPARGGRPRSDDRRILNAILFVQRTGVPWSRIPGELGNAATANRRWHEWQRAGIWRQIQAILGEGDAATA